MSVAWNICDPADSLCGDRKCGGNHPVLGHVRPALFGTITGVLLFFLLDVIDWTPEVELRFFREHINPSAVPVLTVSSSYFPRGRTDAPRVQWVADGNFLTGVGTKAVTPEEEQFLMLTLPKAEVCSAVVLAAMPASNGWGDGAVNGAVLSWSHDGKTDWHTVTTVRGLAESDHKNFDVHPPVIAKAFRLTRPASEATPNQSAAYLGVSEFFIHVSKVELKSIKVSSLFSSAINVKDLAMVEDIERPNEGVMTANEHDEEFVAFQYKHAFTAYGVYLMGLPTARQWGPAFLNGASLQAKIGRDWVDVVTVAGVVDGKKSLLRFTKTVRTSQFRLLKQGRQFLAVSFFFPIVEVKDVDDEKK
jgi:hypothetical protein